MGSAITLHVLTEKRSDNSKAFNAPLLQNRRWLQDSGLAVRFFYDEPYNSRLCECDVLWVNSKCLRRWWKRNKDGLMELLQSYAAEAPAFAYIDTTDSSGTVQYEVLPFVSRYFKYYLLSDKHLYLKKFYGGRIYTDYYHSTCGLADEESFPDSLGPVTKESHLAKLSLAWNQALSFPFQKAPRLLPRRSKKTVSPLCARPIDVSCRIAQQYSRETIAYQRKHISAVLSEMDISTEKLPARRYYAELRKAKIGVSPFGWGEFAYRDFEIILAGCLLYKPDMSHCLTWPDLYKADETYVPFKWDLSDFKSKLMWLLEHPETVQQYARHAQHVLAWYRESREARDLFCARVWRMVRETAGEQ